MLHSFLHALVESNALWLMSAALGVLVLALYMVIASVMMRESDEPFYAAPQRPDDESKMIV